MFLRLILLFQLFSVAIGAELLHPNSYSSVADTSLIRRDDDSPSNNDGGGSNKARQEVRLAGQFTIDTVKLTWLLMNETSIAENRESFVKGALLRTTYMSKGECNVLIFNLAQEFHWHTMPDYDHTVYTQTFYGLQTYGIWIFKSYAKFQNYGNGGMALWAYYGRVKQEVGNLTFYDMQ